MNDKELKQLAKVLEEAEIAIDDFFEGANFTYSVLEEYDMDISFDAVQPAGDSFIFCSYYSDKIQKSIILDWDVCMSFGSYYELAQTIDMYNSAAKRIERELPESKTV